MLSTEGVTNREIHTNPDLLFSKNLNIELLDDADVVRTDLKVDDSGFACCVLSQKHLLFVRLNGNHAMPRLMDIVNAPPSAHQVAEYIGANHQFRDEVGRGFFASWVARHEWGLK